MMTIPMVKESLTTMRSLGATGDDLWSHREALADGVLSLTRELRTLSRYHTPGSSRNMLFSSAAGDLENARLVATQVPYDFRDAWATRFVKDVDHALTHIAPL